MLVIQLLILLEVLECPILLEDGALTFYISFCSTILNMVTFFFIKRLEMQAASESFIMICLEGMTANISWLPHNKKIRDYDNPNLNIDYGNLKTSIPFFTKSLGFYFQVNFQFNDITLKSFITEVTKRVSALKLLRADDGADGEQEGEKKQSKMRIAIGQACKNISINDFIHLCNLIPEDEVDLIVSGVKYDRMIKIGKQRNQIFKRDKDDKYLEGYTPTGQPLVFACIDSEPYDQ
jgi:hypothetical protein